MKSLLLIASLVIGFSAHAQLKGTETVTIERSRTVVPLTVELNKDTVRCLLGDYSSTSLKISVPELKGSTAFPQTTAGETAPCINAGSCRFGKTPDGRRLDPSLIIDANKPTEDIQITVVLNEVLYINHDKQTCDRSLSERIDSTVRGIKFAHQDGASLGALEYDVCMKMHP
ncbi:MAG: hypothetical protein ACXVA9_06580 [Bdellovibrionales bacterium]